MSIKITLPKPNIDDKIREQQIRKIIGEDFEKKEGIISKVLIFTYLHAPISITRLTDEIQNYYQIEFDRVKIFRAVQRLSKLNVMQIIKVGDVFLMDDEELSKEHIEIKRQHKIFLNKLSPQFRNRYNNMNYTWISKNGGEKYLEWACKLNGFKYEDGKK